MVIGHLDRDAVVLGEARRRAGRERLADARSRQLLARAASRDACRRRAAAASPSPGRSTAGDIEATRKPRPISAMASSGLPPISPQSVTGQPGRVAALRDELAAPAAPAGSAGRSGRPRARFSRSAANRNCIRSFEPTERKSAALASSSSWNSSEGTSTIAPSFDRAGSAWPWRARCALLALDERPWPGRTRRTVATIGNMILSSRPAAAFSRARSCARSRPGRSRPMRIARQPSAGFSSSTWLHVGQDLVAADVERAERDRLVAGRVEDRA